MVTRRLSLDTIERLRAHRWRTAPARQVSDERGALRLVRELGFALLMPIAGAELPNIHQATSKPWAWWDWKQTLPGRKACYYAKVIRRRGTFISWDWFPCFHAAYADPRPYHEHYRDGLLERDEKLVLDIIAERGPLMTSELRLAFGPRSKANTRRVKSILVDLQTRFLVTTAGGDTAGWSHHRWDLVARWAPPASLAEAARLSPEEARLRLVRQFVRIMVATTEADIAWTFGWERPEVRRSLARLQELGEIAPAWVPELECQVLAPVGLACGRAGAGR